MSERLLRAVVVVAIFIVLLTFVKLNSRTRKPVYPEFIKYVSRNGTLLLIKPHGGQYHIGVEFIIIPKGGESIELSILDCEYEVLKNGGEYMFCCPESDTFYFVSRLSSKKYRIHLIRGNDTNNIAGIYHRLK